jgi:hypothetical protein
MALKKTYYTMGLDADTVANAAVEGEDRLRELLRLSREPGVNDFMLDSDTRVTCDFGNGDRFGT